MRGSKPAFESYTRTVAKIICAGRGYYYPTLNKL